LQFLLCTFFHMLNEFCSHLISAHAPLSYECLRTALYSDLNMSSPSSSTSPSFSSPKTSHLFLIHEDLLGNLFVLLFFAHLQIIRWSFLQHSIVAHISVIYFFISSEFVMDFTSVFAFLYVVSRARTLSSFY